MNEPNLNGNRLMLQIKTQGATPGDRSGYIYALLPEGAAGQISDGFHTFSDLYSARHLLFLGLVKLQISLNEEIGGLYVSPFKSRQHWVYPEGVIDVPSLLRLEPCWDGWFLVGMELPTGPISFHLPNEYWDICAAEETDEPDKWDGHTSQDVIERLTQWLK